MPKVLRQVLSLFLLILLLSSAIMSLARLQDPSPPWIFFIRDQGNGHDIYRMNLDGSEQKNLTNSPGYEYWVSWSSGNGWLLFDYILPFHDFIEIYRMPLTGGHRQNLNITDKLLRIGIGIANNQSPEVSPDGQWILFNSKSYSSGHSDIYRMRPDGSNIQQLTNDKRENVGARWSPDGQYIVFVAASGQLGSQQIYRMNADGSEQIALTDNAKRNDRPTWSPDGEWILFISAPEGTYEYDIYRVRPDGSELEFFLSVGEGLRTIRWADHQHLLLTIMDGVAFHIYRYNIEIEEMTQLTNTGYNYNPVQSSIIDLPWRGLPMLLSSALLLLLIAWQGRRSNQALTA